MIVLSLTACPDSLRGDLTKWLMEVSAGVFVGQVNARIRDKLWQRVQDNSKTGRAVLVYSTNNEQRLDFRIHGDTWEPIDFDGIKLMLRPSPTRLKQKQTGTPPTPIKKGFSNAAKMRAAKRFSKTEPRYPNDYIVIDIETTGLNPEIDKIIELSALKIIDSEPIDSYCSLVAQKEYVSKEISSLTGITDDQLASFGKDMNGVLSKFVDFIGDLPIVAHNADFDRNFLQVSLKGCALEALENNWIDTLSMSRSMIKNLGGYKLKQLAEHLDIAIKESDADTMRKSMKDCTVTHLLYQKLIKLE